MAAGKVVPGRVALITGASSGIGEATARRLQGAGFIVYAGARRVERMQELKALGVHVLALDVTDDQSLVAAVAAVIAESGRLDVLVNNAGYGSFGALEDVPLAEGRQQFEVNLFGLARLTQLVLPHMRRQRSGTIVNISSIAGKIYEPCGSWYHASKFAVEGMSDCLRLEVRDFGINVVLIEPGGTTSEWSGIARDKLLQASATSPYQEMARRDARLLAVGEKRSLPADAIAKLIETAVATARPKARYVPGGSAAFILALRRILPDRAMDAIMGLLAR
ncbi:MAG: oxidoreductase [Thermoleophilia bacterium]